MNINTRFVNHDVVHVMENTIEVEKARISAYRFLRYPDFVKRRQLEP